MKRTLATTILLTVFTVASVCAQDRTAAPSTSVESKFQADVTMTSAMLKDTRSAVDARLATVNKQLATANEGNKEKLSTQKGQLAEAQSTLDQMLGMVNSAKAEDWQRIRSKAQAVNDMVRDTLAGMK